MANLFDISERYNNVSALLLDDSIPAEVLAEALDSIGDEFGAKADNIVRFVKSLEGDCETLKKEEVRLASKRKVLENKTNRLKQYLEDNMRLTNNTKFKTALFAYNIQNNPPSLKVIDESAVPDSYKTVEQVIKVDKKAILAQFKEGIEIEGCSVSQTSSLRIR